MVARSSRSAATTTKPSSSKAKAAAKESSAVADPPTGALQQHHDDSDLTSSHGNGNGNGNGALPRSSPPSPSTVSSMSQAEDEDMLDDQAAANHAGGGATNDGLDEDMRTAIAALGIMRRGGSSNGGTAPPLTPQQPQMNHSDHPHGSEATSSTSYTVTNGRTSGWTGPSTISGGASSSSSAASTSSSYLDHTRTSSSVGTSEGAMSDDLHHNYDGNDKSGLGDDGTSSSAAGAETETGNVNVNDPNFIARVSQLPIVSGGIEWYERSKASSRVVKYGAGVVESSISTIGRPIANNLRLGSLDDFACRQLDRFGSSPSTTDQTPLPAIQSQQEGDEKANDAEMAQSSSSTRRRHSKGSSMGIDGEEEERAVNEDPLQGTQQVSAEGRSRWQTVLVEAGGLGAAVSEESLKSLRYCLQWLLYATAHLDHQIATLREFIASLHSHTDRESDALVTASASARLSQIKHDVVETIRKVVDVVSKYAGVALPEQAKRYVRQSILGLPVKWASAIEGSRNARAQSIGAHSTASTPRAERMEDPYAAASAPSPGPSSSTATTESAGTSTALAPTEDAAERILTFAVESLDMLRGVTGIFSDSVARAEDWIERLRIIGLDRQRQRQHADGVNAMPPPAIDGSATGMKRRRAIGSDGEIWDSTSSGVEAQAREADEGITRRKRGTRSREPTASLE
ncbi:BQ5605_C002g01760 [Microbotryum silenes-dioicae]|uniref:BQ5605_C002g01760 protein n=1 Tax=Microbotryum silenes-dioicae TaxID=796604 RepID=A0A2X0M414_9BASI|nr:BQ5605_C002g01760 [Microbotryum silenes-dioicae]